MEIIFWTNFLFFSVDTFIPSTTMTVAIIDAGKILAGFSLSHWPWKHAIWSIPLIIEDTWAKFQVFLYMRSIKELFTGM